MKKDSTWPNSTQTTSEHIVQIMSNETSLLFEDFFKNKPLLVPIPRSSLIKPDTLWVPNQIAISLINNGFGSESIPCLKRKTALPRAAGCSPTNRPRAIDHYNSLSVETLSEPDEILLIDDVVTRGATIIGAANRLASIFPKSRIRAFTLIRTVSIAAKFTNILDPYIGTIELAANGETFRTP